MKFCKNRIISRISLGITFALGSAISVEAANIPAYTVGNPSLNPTNSDFTSAIQFDVIQELDLTGIGVYRGGSDGSGILEPRQVGLWDVNNNVLLTPNISIGETTPNTFDVGDGFLYLPLNQTLPTGTYRLGTYIDTAGDNAIFPTVEVTFNSSIVPTPVPNFYQETGDTFPSFPDQQEISNPGIGYRISANLLFDDGTGGGGPNPDPNVPEPSLIGGLLLFGLGGLLQKRRDET